MQTTSPPWNTTTKAIVAVSALALFCLLVWVFRGLLQQVVLAVILAYLLHPLISLIDRRTPVNRVTVVLAVYLTLAVIVIATFSLVGVTTFQQALDLSRRLPGWFEEGLAQFQLLQEQLPESIVVAGMTVPVAGLVPQLPGWNELFSQVFDLLQPLLGRSGSLAASVVTGTVAVLGQILLIFIISIYIAVDIPRIGNMIANIAHKPGFRRDAERLTSSVSQVWAAYMRGQALLAIIIFVLVSVVLGALGVDNALGLGLLSGAMEFLPVIGPLAGAGAAIFVAFFQSDPSFGLTPLQFAIAVTVAMIVIQQVENTLLVPRIVGKALNLHPLLVMVSVIMGASLAGLLGAILAAPVVASIRILGEYAWHKMLDLPPFPDEEDGRAEPMNNSTPSSEVRPPPEPLGVYPLSFQPVFKDYIWGGRNLETRLGRELPSGIIAESWEIAAHANGHSKVEAGPLAGYTLEEVQQRWGAQFIGTSLESDSFPLLIKLLDSNRWLSVQVHPDDAYAHEHAGDLGKTELWVILHAEPGAEIIYGLKAGVDRELFAQSAATGDINAMLHRIPVRTGDAVYIPAGTVHALGPGAIVAEIQQNSDTTYRLYDWGRTGADGQSRPLHVRQALDVIDWRMVEPAVVAPPILDAPEGWVREALADLRTIGGPAAANLRTAADAETSCPYFRVDRLTGIPGAAWEGDCDGSAFQIWGCLSGRASLHCDGETVDFQEVSWLLLPAALGAYRIRAETHSVLLRIL
ncbi:MAG: AI-2E family transporter [Candidatus Tectomicrobia bacterium]|nr:AI-2E family transporter [Candidatus Tectomicrobia bacterium]